MKVFSAFPIGPGVFFINSIAKWRNFSQKADNLDVPVDEF